MNFVPAQSVYCNYWTRCQSSQQLRNRPFESCIDNAVNDYADTNLSYINTVIQCFITKTKRGKILYHCPLYEKKVQLMYCLLSMLFVNIPPPGPPTHYLTQIPPPLLPAWGGGGVDCYNHETSHSLLDLFLLSQKNFVYSIDDSFLYLKGVWI